MSRPDCAYNLLMRISFDPSKNERNIRKRGLSFELASAFEFETATVRTDFREDYGEVRYLTPRSLLGSMRGCLHVLCFTETPDGIRVISFRKANDRELKNYAQAQTPD